MNSRKSVGLRMEPQGTPALTGYCEDFLSRTTRSHLLLRKEEIKPIFEMRIMFESLGKCDFLFLSYKMYVYLKIHVCA